MSRRMRASQVQDDNHMEKQTFSPVQCEMNACASDVHSFQASVMRVRVDALSMFTPHVPQATTLPLYLSLGFRELHSANFEVGPGEKREFGFPLRRPPPITTTPPGHPNNISKWPTEVDSLPVVALSAVVTVAVDAVAVVAPVAVLRARRRSGSPSPSSVVS